MSQCKCAESDFIVRMRFQFIFSFIAANRMPWRYIVVTTTFAAVLSITAMRYCFSLTLTQMVRAPTLSSNAPIDAQSCPINAATTQSNVSHTIAVAVGRSVDFFLAFTLLTSLGIVAEWHRTIRLVTRATGNDFVLILFWLCIGAFSWRFAGRLARWQSGHCDGAHLHRSNYDDHTDGGWSGRCLRSDCCASVDGSDAGWHLPRHQYDAVGVGAGTRTRSHGIAGVLRISGE